VQQLLQADFFFYNLSSGILDDGERAILKPARCEYEKNKMLLLIMSSMYEQYREGDGARWF